MGGASYESRKGTAWVFTRSGSTWSQQGPRLTGAGEVKTGGFGRSVALAADGRTALIGGLEDDGGIGAAWVFTRAGGAWSQQGPKLTGGGAVGKAQFGNSLALTADGDTALIGGNADTPLGGSAGSKGAAWVFARAGTSWSQQGSPLTGGGEVGGAFFGDSVALSADGSAAMIGGLEDNGRLGAAWPFVRRPPSCEDSWTDTAGGSWFTAGGLEQRRASGSQRSCVPHRFRHLHRHDGPDRYNWSRRSGFPDGRGQLRDTDAGGRRHVLAQRRPDRRLGDPRRMARR